MAKRHTAIPKAPLARILNNAGADRVSKDGLDSFSDVIEKLAHDICSKAIDIAKHSHRKTIKEEDIRLSAKMK